MDGMGHIRLLAMETGSQTCNNSSGSGNVSGGGVAGREEEALFVDVSGYVVPVVFAFIFVLGVLGNGTLVLIVLVNRNMRTAPNIYIVSLALGDLLLIVVSVPFFALIYTYPNWQHGEFLCKLNGFLKALSLGVSIFTLTALSGDRYTACMYPMRRHLEKPVPKTPLIAAAIWVLASALAMFEGTIIHVSELQFGNAKPFKVCHSHPSHWGPLFPCFRACTRFAIYFLIPILIIGVLYSLMARSLWLSHCDIPGDTVPPADQATGLVRQAGARKKIAKLVLAIVILFVLCWLPRHVFLLWFQCSVDGEYNMFWHVWKITAFCLCFINSCINPVALYILSDQYRSYFNRYLCCGWRRAPSPHRPLRAGTNPWQTASLSTHRSKQAASHDCHNGRLSTTQTLL